MSSSERPSDDPAADTTGEWYAARLDRGWRARLPDPFRANIRRLRLGRVLDVGCGIGRCLAFIDGNGVGVDHNPTSVARCRERGLEAYTPAEFLAADRGAFDTLLLSHVLEHTDEAQGAELLAGYVGHIRRGGRVLLITPQPAGQRSDPTHVRPIDRSELQSILEGLGCTEITTRSFPFPAIAGRGFRHNENHAIGRLPY